MDGFSSLDLQFVRAWKEILGSAPGDWTPKGCSEGHSSFLSYHDWWSRAQPPVELGIFREVLRMLKNQYGRQPAFEDVYKGYRSRAGLSTVGYSDTTSKCSACNGTGVVIFPTLLRRGRVYCVDATRQPPALRQGEYIGQGTAPCADCDAGRRVNGRWHMPASVVARCNRSRMMQSEYDLWLHGPVKEGDAGSPAVNHALTHLTPRVAATALKDDDARRQANIEEWDTAAAPDPWAGVAQEDRF